MLKKLLTIVVVTGALLSMTTTTAFAKSVGYSHYDDRYMDHWNYNTPDYDIYDDWEYWEINHSNDDYYSYYDDVDYYDYDKSYYNYYNDYDYNFNDFNLNLALDDKYNYIVQPFIYDLWYDDVYTNYYFPTAVGVPYAQPVAPVMNYYYPPFSYYVY